MVLELALCLVASDFSIEPTGVAVGANGHCYLNLRVINKSTGETATFMDKRFVPNHRWRLEDKSGKPVPRTDYGLLLDKQSDPGAYDYCEKIVLGPGQEFRYQTIPVDLCFKMNRGETYTVLIEYYEPYQKPVLRIKAKPFKFTFPK